MIILGRRFIMTTLAEIPRAFRVAPGVLALNADELAAIRRNNKSDAPIIKPIIDIVRAEDMADALLQMRKPKPRRSKIGPSVRMAMLAAIGLAAPQIGVHLRVIAVDPRGFHGFRLLINPEILELGGQVVEADEGCMSIGWGHKRFKVKRHTTARIRFIDKNGDERHANTAAFATRLICHEIDHLDGKLIA